MAYNVGSFEFKIFEFVRLGSTARLAERREAGRVETGLGFRTLNLEFNRQRLPSTLNASLILSETPLISAGTFLTASLAWLVL